jgi:hypothetical protein
VHIYYIPETCAYRILGSTELFLQHCQLPDMTPYQHLHALTNKLTNCSAPTSTTPKGKLLLHMLYDRIGRMLAPPPTAKEQRVSNILRNEAEQRVIDDTPIIHIPCLTDAPGIMELYNPTDKRALKQTPCFHWQVTWNNTPGILPVPVLDGTSRQSTRVDMPQNDTPLPSRAHWHRLTRHAINALMAIQRSKCNNIFTPITLLTECTFHPTSIHFKHITCPIVHPVTGTTIILSYKKLMNDPATAETWQTAFGKDFGGMAQGDNKTRQKGTNAMFVMTHNKIKHVLQQGKTFTYGNPVVDYCPQKEDLHRI